jgi:hypothetical protein
MLIMLSYNYIIVHLELVDDYNDMPTAFILFEIPPPPKYMLIKQIRIHLVY